MDALVQTAEAVADRTGAAVAGGQRYLRPPGALSEAPFLLACNRCGMCGEACPSGAIRFLGPAAGAAAGTPYIDPELAPCHQCLECVNACDTGALIKLTDPRQIQIGVATLNTASCWAHQGRLCDVCYGVCPFPDQALRMEAGQPVINPDCCTGCGLCAFVCPSTPNSIAVNPA